MKRELTLRYLLLRHLKRFADRVPRERLVEVTHSLQVVAERERYLVTWRAAGASHSRTFHRDDFVFYQRGDNAPERRALADPLTDANGARAMAFAADVFGVPAPPLETGAGEMREARARTAVAEALGLALVWLAIGDPGVPTTLVWLALCVVEHGRRGRLWSSAGLLFLAYVGPPTAALLGALSYGVLQLLDPDPTDRLWRVALCALAAAGAAFHLTLAASTGSNALAAVALALAVLVGALVRSLFDSHVRAMPLALPFFALGLFLDGRRGAALVALTAVGVSILIAAYSHRWMPVQRQRELTPNG